MPSWSIHLGVAKEISKKINLDNDLFLFGNLIPDVDKETSISRYNAHYYDDIPYPTCSKENMINLNKFLEDYKKDIKDPMILGYYCHLLTDFFYNNIVYSNCWVQDKDNNIIGIRFKTGKILKIDSNDKKMLKRKYKHKDFELYGKYLYSDKNISIPTNYNNIINHKNKLKNSFLTDELIKKRINYLNNDFKKINKLSIVENIFKNKYTLFSKEELDKIFEDCINYIIKEFDKVSVNYGEKNIKTM